MMSGQQSPAALGHTGGRLAIAAIACAVIFALGAFIGYHSIYRNISVAMAAPPSATQFR